MMPRLKADMASRFTRTALHDRKVSAEPGSVIVMSWIPTASRNGLSVTFPMVTVRPRARVNSLVNTARSMTGLQDSVDDLKDTLQPYRDLMTNVGNRIAEGLTRLTNVVAEGMGKITGAEGLVDRLNRWLGGEGGGPGGPDNPFHDFIRRNVEDPMHKITKRRTNRRRPP